MSSPGSTNRSDGCEVLAVGSGEQVAPFRRCDEIQVLRLRRVQRGQQRRCGGQYSIGNKHLAPAPATLQPAGRERCAGHPDHHAGDRQSGQAFAGRIPEVIQTRRKTGFGPPVRGWVRTDLRVYLNDLLRSRSFRERGLL